MRRELVQRLPVVEEGDDIAEVEENGLHQPFRGQKDWPLIPPSVDLGRWGRFATCQKRRQVANLPDPPSLTNPSTASFSEHRQLDEVDGVELGIGPAAAAGGERERLLVRCERHAVE